MTTYNPALDTAAVVADRTRWTVDAAHSTMGFGLKHMMIATVRGRFTKFDAVIETDGPDLAPRRVEATIDVASIDTGVAQRDDHLRSPDFFDAAAYPTIRFASTRITPLGGGRYTIVGDLTIKDTTRPVSLALEVAGVTRRDPWGGLRTGATATARLNRKDWGLNWNQAIEAGGVLVGDEISLAIEIEAVAESPVGAA